jgi:CRISPR-associated protein Csh1
MQDKAITAIGQWQLENKQDLEPVDLYIENMFPGKDYQILLLVFEITKDGDTLKCRLKDEIDIEKVGKDTEVYKKFAYRKGAARGGDITFTTKLSLPVTKKIKTIKDLTFRNILKLEDKFEYEAEIFKLIKEEFIDKEEFIKDKLTEILENFDKKAQTTTGVSFLFEINGEKKYLYDFDIIKEAISTSAQETKFTHAGTVSKTKNKISSITGKNEEEIYGFAAPFKYASPDKPGFISGFFDKKNNWRNYPIGKHEALLLEIGKKYIMQNLTGYFYGNEYMLVPHPIIKSDKEQLSKIINLLQTAFDEEKKAKAERKKRAEDRIQKIIANEKNYFTLDMMFYKEDKKTKAITINLMIEEILPSRFRTLFIDVPEKINKYKIFKNAITIKKEQQDLHFSFGIIKEFFDTDFLDVVNKLFKGEQISEKYLFEKIMYVIRKNYNESKTSDKWVEPTDWTVKKAIMLIHYLQNLGIINFNKNYKYMETTNVTHQTSFNLEEFENFVKENQDFLDSEIKVGIFAVGVLVRFLFDIQNANLHNTPFESKLRGYKLNADLLMSVYTEALDKIQKYQNFYTYLELRDIINKNFTTQIKELNKLTNNEISFYFVAGLEMGKQFKHEKEDN